MFSILRGMLVFPLHLSLQLINLSFWAILIICLGLLKFVLPFAFISRAFNPVLDFMLCAFGVISVRLIRLFNPV